MFANLTVCGSIAGDGSMLGFIPNNAKVPAIPTTVERMKPDFDLSTRYHSTGFTSARVRETWSVDCQGNFLCVIMVSTVETEGLSD
jgi:hypothetical protein